MIQAGKDTPQLWGENAKKSLSGILDLQSEGREGQKKGERGEAPKGLNSKGVSLLISTKTLFLTHLFLFNPKENHLLPKQIWGHNTEQKCL